MLNRIVIFTLCCSLVTPSFGQESEAPSFWDDVETDIKQEFPEPTAEVTTHEYFPHRYAAAIGGGVFYAMATNLQNDEYNLPSKRFKLEETMGPGVMRRVNDLTSAENELEAAQSALKKTRDSHDYLASVGDEEAKKIVAGAEKRVENARESLKTAKKNLKKIKSDFAKKMPLGKKAKFHTFNAAKQKYTAIRIVSGVAVPLSVADLVTGYCIKVNDIPDTVYSPTCTLGKIVIANGLERVSKTIGLSTKGASTETETSTSERLNHAKSVEPGEDGT